MRVISRARLVEFWEVHPEAKGTLSAWERGVRHAEWSNFAAVKRTFNSVDAAYGLVVFNAGSNRIIADIHYDGGRVYLRHVFTHSEYDEWCRTKRGARK